MISFLCRDSIGYMKVWFQIVRDIKDDISPSTACAYRLIASNIGSVHI